MTAATYVLGVVRSGDADRLPAAAAPLGDLRAVPVGAVAVVVCDVAEEVVATLRREDLEVDDVAPLAIAHDDALRALVETRSVVPMRVGTVVGGDEDVPRVLAAAPHVPDVLGRVAGHQEWTVELTRADPTSGDEPTAGTGGRDYLRAARDRLREREHRRQAFEDDVAATAARLADVATAVTRLGAGRSEVARERIACLVPTDHVARLEQEAARAVTTDTHVRVHGPYPPYHFVGAPS